MMGLDDLHDQEDIDGNFASDQGRAHTEFNSPPDYGMSQSSMYHGKSKVVNSMQERNRQMRSDVKV